MIAHAPGIFRYPGGKNKPAVRSWILHHAPKNVREYREPFVGGGGVFWGMNKAEAYWVNDVNPGLVAVYQALADRPHEFIAKCREIEPRKPSDPMSKPGPRGGLPTNARLKAVFDSMALNEDCDQALRYFFVNRTVFGGRVNYDIPSRLYFSNAEGWDIVKTDSLERSAKKLVGVRVTCGDYRQLLSEPGEDVWIYCDPPYIVNTGLTPSSQLYQFGFTEQDHLDFADAVKASPHKIAVSYDDDPEGIIRSLFPESDGFHIVENDWAYCGTTNDEKEKGRELLILNYDPPRNLFTMLADATDISELSELETLADLEPIIERYRRCFVDAGNALRTIRDRRLYRAEHGTFEEYCEKRWGFTPQYANKLVLATDTVAKLETIVSNPPIVEAHVRELLALETTEQQAEAWTATVTESESTGVPITAKLIRQHVQTFLPPGDPPTLSEWNAKFLLLWKKVPQEIREDFGKFALDKITKEIDP